MGRGTRSLSLYPCPFILVPLPYFITNFLNSFFVSLYVGQKLSTNARNFLLWFFILRWQHSWMMTYLIYLVGRWTRSRFSENFWSCVQDHRLELVFLIPNFLYGIHNFLLYVSNNGFAYSSKIFFKNFVVAGSRFQDCLSGRQGADCLLVIWYL